MRKPTPRPKKFILCFVACGNATQAAKEAGFSPKNAGWIGRDLLQKPYVREEIERRQGKLAAKLEISAETVVGGLARVAFADVGELFDADSQLRPIQTWPENIRMAVAGVDVVQRVGKDGIEQAVTKVRLSPRTDALHLLARALGSRGFRPALLDLPPPDPSPDGKARIQLADLLAEMSPEDLALFKRGLGKVRETEQRLLTQTIEGDAEERPDDADENGEG
jgi:phage terminase small subunit